MPLYISKNSRELGPFEEATVFEMLRNGEILPEDFAKFEGESQWSQLKILFPHLVQEWKSSLGYTPPQFIQPKAKSDRKSHIDPNTNASPNNQLKLALGALSAISLIIFSVLGFTFFTSNSSISSNSNSKPRTHNLSWTKFDPLRVKSEEFAQMSPTLQLAENPKIKGKVLVVVKERDRTAEIKGFDQYFNGYSLSNYETYGLAKRRLAATPEEIETIIQIFCYKGNEITTFENGVKGYENLCKVSLIDYKNNIVIAQEIFRNNRPPEKIDDIYKNLGEFVFLKPYDLIGEYITKFPLEKLNDPTTLVPLNDDNGKYGKYHSFKNIASELARIDLPIKLDEKATIKGKVAIAQVDYNGGADLKGFDSYGKEFYKYELDRFGLNQEKMAESEEEIDTLIRINCRKGEMLKTDKLPLVYSNKCEVSVVNYKQSVVIAQKNFEGKQIFGEINTKIYPLQYVVIPPFKEIEQYVKNFPKN